MRNLKDLAHRIASGEEVGNLNFQAEPWWERVLNYAAESPLLPFCFAFGRVFYRAYWSFCCVKWG